MLPISTTPISRRLSLRFTSSQIWKPYMRGSAAESSAARGSWRWISSIASTPSVTLAVRSPQLRSASSVRLARAASGSATSTRSAAAPTGGGAGSGAGSTWRVGGATAAVVSTSVASGERTRNTAWQREQRSFTPSARSFSFSMR
jgi:hypothetical protein